MLLRLVLAALGGLALAAAFEPLAWAPLALVGVAGYAAALADVSIRRAGLLGLVFGVAFYLPHIRWMQHSVGTDAWLALAGVEAAFYGLLGLAVPLLRRLPGWPVWLAAAWVSVESVRTVWPFSGMPWGRVSFAAIDTPVAPATAYVGMTGLSFLLVLAGFLLGAWLRPWLPDATEGRRGALRGPLLLAGAVGVLALLLVPAVRPFEVEQTGSATVAAIQGNVPGPGNDILWDHRQVTRNLTEATEELAADVEAGRVARPDFVVWPENGTAVDPFLDEQINKEITAAVATVGVPVLAAAIVSDGPRHILNQGIVWDPETGPGERYTKRHPVAYGEYIPYRDVWEPQFGRLSEISRDMKAGTSTNPLTIAGVEVGDAICFDVGYDEVLRGQVAAGAEMLTVQTSNAMFIFTHQIDQQFAITRLRAIETGRWLVVASPNGRSGIIAPDGTVAQAAPLRETDVMVQQVGLSTTLTPAVRAGAWPTRGLAVVALLALVWGVIAHRRARPSPEGEPVDPAPEVVAKPTNEPSEAPVA